MTTSRNAGASLGGEGFLKQSANVSDMNNNMNRESITLTEERQRFECEKDARSAEASTKNRQRSRPTLSCEGMHVESAPVKPRHSTLQRQTPNENTTELKERDAHIFERSLQKWANTQQRCDTTRIAG